MSVIAFLDKLFGRTDSSRETAKNRLKLVLVHDRAAIPPALMDQLRAELLDVLSKYLEIDQAALEMNLEKADGTIAIMANIPILRVRNELLHGDAAEQAVEAQEIPAEGDTPATDESATPAGEAVVAKGDETKADDAKGDDAPGGSAEDKEPALT